MKGHLAQPQNFCTSLTFEEVEEAGRCPSMGSPSPWKKTQQPPKHQCFQSLKLSPTPTGSGFFVESTVDQNPSKRTCLSKNTMEEQVNLSLVTIEDEMRTSHGLRNERNHWACPDVRDGLEAVHRVSCTRCTNSATHASQLYKECRVVGDVIGKYSPTVTLRSTIPSSGWPRTSPCATCWWMDKETSVRWMLATLRCVTRKFG